MECFWLRLQQPVSKQCFAHPKCHKQGPRQGGMHAIRVISNMALGHPNLLKQLYEQETKDVIRLDDNSSDEDSLDRCPDIADFAHNVSLA